MKYSRAQLCGLLQTWADWKINGGWSYAMPAETAEGLKIRAPGTHSDPTLARMIAMEMGGDRAAASVDGFVKALPRLRRALVNSTYYDPLVDKEPFDLRLVLRDYGISARVYYDQIGEAMESLRIFLAAIKSSEPGTDGEIAAINEEIVREAERPEPDRKRLSKLHSTMGQLIESMREAQRRAA